MFNRHAFENNHISVVDGCEAIERQALTPAFCIIERETFFDLNGFDEFYYNSYEGLDLTFLISINGGHCFVAPEIQAYHIRKASRSSVFFSEEQQNPHFWTKYVNEIQNDYDSCVMNQLSPKDFKQHYMVCEFTHLNLLNSVEAIGLSIAEHIDLQQEGDIELFGTLPFSFLKTPHSLLFLCENFKQLAKNQLWIKARGDCHDLIIDSSANVIHLTQSPHHPFKGWFAKMRPYKSN